MHIFIFYFAFTLSCLPHSYALTTNEILSNGLTKTDSTLKQISDKWEIPNFPNFLRSVAMTHTSWEVLKLKYQRKILNALLNENDKTKFIITFTGSSVTAGHDTDFNISFSELTGKVMEPVFKELNIVLESRNAALGNNPCLPYDVCVRAFAGSDVDIIHWEQSYNCDGGDGNKKYVFEQFVRQSLSIPSRPVVVFSNSVTPNWDKDKCKSEKRPILIKPEERHMLAQLNSDPIKIPSEYNKHEIQRHWQAFTEIITEYKSAGLQFWQHEHYEEYKCHAPYVPEWGCCSASWHPSVLGHALRADHYSFFWLLILKDAISDIQKRLQTTTEKELLEEIDKHISSESKHIPTHAIHDSPFADGLRCFTSFQPRSDDTLSLEALAIPPPSGAKPAFQFDIFENMFEPAIVNKAKARGYRDFKYMFYGNKDSSPLSLRVDVQVLGTSFICQPPGNWGKLPNGFLNLWECDTKMYLTENVVDVTSFSFAPEKAREVKYVQKHAADSQMNLCVEFEGQLPLGHHVLTVVPTTENKITLAYLILP